MTENPLALRSIDTLGVRHRRDAYATLDAEPRTRNRRARTVSRGKTAAAHSPSSLTSDSKRAFAEAAEAHAVIRSHLRC